MRTDESPPIILFGEALWDSLPRGLFPGGAPLNVAYHLRKFGLRPILVTAVGRDVLGDELRRRMDSWGFDPMGVTVSPERRTGLSRVSLDAGIPGFEIESDVAWDRIDLTAEVVRVAVTGACMVFGSLSQRSPHNRAQLATLLELCPTALKVLDVNLRPPFDAPELVWDLAARADIVKLNEQELGILLGEAPAASEFGDAVRCFARRAQVREVCLTAGPLGAGLLVDDRWFWRPARPALVRDTVGAGDAFLAAWLFGRSRETEPPERTLRRASRLARFIVTQDGPTPRYRLDSEGNLIT